MRDRTSHDTRLVFLDIETSGLDPYRDVILEIGARVVTSDLEVVSHGSPDYQRLPQWSRSAVEIIETSNEFVGDTHRTSGLVNESMEERLAHGIDPTIAQIEEEMIVWLRDGHGFGPGTAVLAGYSIHFDRSFIKALMPGLDAFLHFRMIDVSGIREAYQRWIDPGFGERWKVTHGVVKHRVMSDIDSCIAELRVYKDRCFR